MDPEHSNFLCFLWNGSLYRFLTLCFGIKNAPFIFHRVGRAIILHFNSLGIRLIIYLDDILVLGRTPGQCVRDAQIFVDTLVKLGFHFKIGKCVLKPSQEFFFLGFIWNTVTMQVHLPEEKLLTIHMLSLEILSKKKRWTYHWDIPPPLSKVGVSKSIFFPKSSPQTFNIYENIPYALNFRLRILCNI